MIRTAAQIRQEFIDFFRHKHGHALVPSSPVVPHDDPTLLFTNAGMNQFKPYFLGTETPKHTRVANTQKCIRAGGKHNDLDDVGHDTYHHTFFEMLGNWSFGDYFKKEAIAWAWELLVDVWGIDPTRLHATYFGGDPAEGLEPDNEARDLWSQILPPERVHAGSKKDNFWEMGETGPCGPCSEVHIDLTPDKSGAKLVNAGDARAIEIWNLVFIQFNRAADGKLTPLPARHVDTGMGFERVTAVLQGHNNNYATDVFVPIIQAIEEISGHTYGSEPGAAATGQPPSLVGRGPGEGPPPVPPGGIGVSPASRYAAFRPGDMRDESCRVIADHIRCLTFAITDGAIPDKEDRGYVLRRILRRAAWHGQEYLCIREPFLWRLVDVVVGAMSDAFPELRRDPARVAAIVRDEEESFGRTLERGRELFENYARNINLIASGQYRKEEPPPEPLPRNWIHPREAEIYEKAGRSVVPGAAAFKLHDTYGFPIDLTQIMAVEKGLRVDIAEYERLMKEARERARANIGAALPLPAAMSPEVLSSLSATDDSPKYVRRALSTATTQVIRFTLDGQTELIRGNDALRQGERGALVLRETCFYAEQGGQVGDCGAVVPAHTARESDAQFDVEDTARSGDAVLHIGKVSRGAFCVNEPVDVRVDERRSRTMKNHTATHVMNWALREVLGDHVQQKGSLVDHEKTRFDFSNPKALTPEQIERVEQLVNETIRQNLPVHYKVVPQHNALKINGLRAVFGERYPDEVRVMSVGVSVEDLLAKPDNPEWRKYSIEFCGGTHLKNTAEIEHFAIISEEAVAKGVRRIVAVTGDTAQLTDEIGAALVQRAESLKGGPADAAAEGLAELQNSLASATIPLRQRHRLLELMADLQTIVKAQHKSQAADAAEVVKRAVAELWARAEKIGDTTVVVGEMPDVPIEQLKMGADQIKQKCGSAAILFGVRVAPAAAGAAPADDRSETGPTAPAGSPATDPARSAPESEPGAEARGIAPGASPADDRSETGPTAPAGSPVAGKALLLAAMTPDLVKKGLKAGDLVKAIAPIVGGGGGGPPTMAQAGGKQPEKIAEALDAGRKWIVSRLAT